VPRLCELNPGICLTTDKKHGKTSVRVAEECQLELTVLNEHLYNVDVVIFPPKYEFLLVESCTEIPNSLKILFNPSIHPKIRILNWLYTTSAKSKHFI